MQAVVMLAQVGIYRLFECLCKVLEMPAFAGMTLLLTLTATPVFAGMTLLLALTATPVYSCDTIDDAGNAIHLARPAARIISLAPDITEILFAIGAGNQIVGVISGSDYPAAAKKIQAVGSTTGLDIELIVSLHPDLIMTWDGNFSRQLARIRALGIPVYHNNPRKIQDIAMAMQTFGCLTGRQNEAGKKAKAFSELLSKMRHDYQTGKPVRVFYQLGSMSLMTINKDSWINEVIELCGGQNVFADAKIAAPEVDMESVIAANPEVIVVAATSSDWKQKWRQYKDILAVKNNRLVTVKPDFIDRAGPRILGGVKQVCEGVRSAMK